MSGMQIPLTSQTDPRGYPGYQFREYPKMMVNKSTNKPYLNASGQPVIVNNIDEENEFLKIEVKKPGKIEVAVVPDEQKDPHPDQNDQFANVDDIMQPEEKKVYNFQKKKPGPKPKNKE